MAAESAGLQILENSTRDLESKLNGSLHIDCTSEEDVDDDSTLGDESAAYVENSSDAHGNIFNDDPYDFLAKQHLDESSSDESSFWSSSDDDDDDDDDEDGDDSTKEDDNEGSDSDASLKHDAANKDEERIKVGASGGVTDVGVIEDQKKRRKTKRRDSTVSALSIDAYITLKMASDKNAKPVPKILTPKPKPVTPKPLDERKGPRRRGRRLEQERESIGSLAKKLGSSTGNEIMSSSVRDTVAKFRRSESATRVSERKPRPKKFVHVQQIDNPQRLREKTSNAMDGPSMRRRSTVTKYGDHAVNLVKPRDHFLKILRNENAVAPMVKYDQLDDFLLPVTDQDKAAFDMALVGAVRDQDLVKVKELQAQGHPLQARSHTGESLLNVCARRGTPEMLRYMLRQEGVSARTCCDYGRTPLHDAAWSADAKSLEMMKILIQECPDMLLILDKRGYMPLDYIPKERWPHCCSFLDKHKDMIMPTGVLFEEPSGSEDDESEDESNDEE